ncbi:MAG: GNAT family N-acetyltransferase [Bacillota bacterium]|nr:GNAT family N-acetyltransferase [Bacillota bacterium]
MIRLMTIEDYDSVYLLWSETKGMGLRSLDDSKEGIEKFLKRNPTTSFVSEIDGEIAGVILCGHDGRRGYIYHTAVKQSQRGKGIGKELIKCAYKALESEGITKGALVVFKTNEIGNSFWKSQGWQKRDDLNYYSKPFDLNNR